MKITFICAVVLILILPSLSFASDDSGVYTVNRVQVNSSGAVLLWGSSVWSNPDFCDRSDIIFILPELDGGINEYYSEMYALAISGYLQGKSINGWLAGCYEYAGNTYPQLRSLGVR